MKQIGLAVHNYESTHSVFPAGSFENSNTGSSGLGASAFTVILPFIDQGNSYKLYKFSEHYGSDDNKATLNQRVSSYLCPSMNIPRAVPDVDCNEIGSPSSYLMSEGTKSYQYPALGVFPMVFPSYDFGSGNLNNKNVRIADITDGTSNTMAVGETSWNFASYNWTATACSAKSGQTRWGSARWSAGYPNIGLGNTNAASTSSVINNFAGSPVGYSSMHAGGITIGLADGSVRFLSENISRDTFNALATRAGGEVLGDF